MTTTGIIGICIFLLLMVLVFCGVPIWVSMLGCSFLGFFLIGGMNLVSIQFTQAPFTLGANYTYAVLPLFMLVGSLAGETGIAQGAFDAMNKWLGRVRGGLLYALVGANAVFGAFQVFLLPEMWFSVKSPCLNWKKINMTDSCHWEQSLVQVLCLH